MTKSYFVTVTQNEYDNIGRFVAKSIRAYDNCLACYSLFFVTPTTKRYHSHAIVISDFSIRGRSIKRIFGEEYSIFVKRIRTFDDIVRVKKYIDNHEFSVAQLTLYDFY